MNNNKGNFLFSFLNQITYLKDPLFVEKASETDLKQVNPFILNKWISMNDDLLILADYLNPLIFNLTTEQLYKIYYQIIPKKKMFFKWVGGNKRRKELHYKFITDLIKREYEISEKECQQYFEIFQKNYNLLIEFIRHYPLEDKELKQLNLTREQVYSNNRLQIKEVETNYIEAMGKKKSDNKWGEDLFE